MVVVEQQKFQSQVEAVAVVEVVVEEA